MKILLKNSYLLAILVFAGSLFHFSHQLNQPPVAVWDEVLQVPAGRSLWTFEKTRYTHTENPPLGKALLGLSIRLFGDQRWAHRLPSALAAAGIATLLFLLVQKMTQSLLAGLLATGLWLTSSMAYLHARLGTLDMMTCFFFVAGFYAFVQTGSEKLQPGAAMNSPLPSRERARERGAKIAWLLAACCLAALGGMVKVIVLLLFPLFLIGLVLKRKEWPLKNSLPWLVIGGIAFSALAFFGIYGFFGYSPTEAIAEVKFIYYFHHHDVSRHESLSSWWDWLLLRGNFWYLKTPLDDGTWVQVLCATNPVLWVFGEISLVGLLILFARTRDPNYLLVFLGFAFQIAFWAIFKERTLLYYALPMEPFFCLAISLAFNAPFHQKPAMMRTFWASALVLISLFGFKKFFPFVV